MRTFGIVITAIILASLAAWVTLYAARDVCHGVELASARMRPCASRVQISAGRLSPNPESRGDGTR